ncbi:CBS domain-containing protein [Thermodesulfovibrio aggregans]|uniref:CBS domain-containing protein n=1 Tax=Thermodesulfovibrio aggregans TaxID=86166 RepID=A0A0U9HR11_9BACT|nr:CBS domain-containing protein [Thermodesulfovibrio aggregans]GAQ94857.1 CBS domain-containing protein [Thermodesulfovibrio aggregans]
MNTKVKEIMNTKLETIQPDATVYDAIEKLVDRRMRSLIVLPKDDNDVYGVITVRDIVFKVISKNLDPHKIKIEEIASKPVISIDKETEIEHLIKLMEKFNIARVFVHEGKQIVGVVSLFDVLSATLIARARRD